MTHTLLRSLIRETLLTEEVYGAQAVVYHGTKADPEQLVSALLNDEFAPGRGAGSMYGKGLYTVYDLRGTQTSSGEYGDHVIKLKLNLYGYIIFDPDVALKVYKAPLSIVEQAQEIGLDEDIIEKLKSVPSKRGEFTSVAADAASKFLRGKVKGIVYTGSSDGRCALVYDAATAVPVAWKNVRDRSWTLVDRDIIKPALRRSASGDFEKDKYEFEMARLFKNLEALPIGQRVVNGNLDLGGTSEMSLPDGLHVRGSLNLLKSSIKSLPEGLTVDGDILGNSSSITSLPKRLQVGGTLHLSFSPITSIPNSIKVSGNINLFFTQVASLPDDLSVGRDLSLVGTPITSLPTGLQVGRNLSIGNTSIKSLPSDLQVGGEIYGFSGDHMRIPPHLKSKVR